MDADTCDVHEWMQVHTASALIRVCPYTHTKKWQQKKQKKMATSNVVSLVLSAITASAATCKKEQIIYNVIFVFYTGHVCGGNVSVTQLTI